MATPRCHRKATHAPPNAAAPRGMQAAIAALYGETSPLPADAQAETYRALRLVPYAKRQGDLPLSLPEPDAR